MNYSQKLYKALKLVYQLIMFTSAPFIVPDFNLLSCKLDKCTFKLLYWVILYWYYIKAKQIYNTLTVPCEKSRMVSVDFSIMKNIAVIPSWSRFSVKLNCYIDFGLTFSVLVYFISALKPIIIL